jgi:hypothetical protein
MLILQVASFSRVMSIAEHLIPILLSFYLGSWSDIYGRIPFIAVSMTGKVYKTHQKRKRVIKDNGPQEFRVDNVSVMGWLAQTLPDTSVQYSLCSC